MKNSAANKAAAHKDLKNMFFDDVFSAHKKCYPELMSHDKFAAALEEYREATNSAFSVVYPSISASVILQMFVEYVAEVVLQSEGRGNY